MKCLNYILLMFCDVTERLCCIISIPNPKHCAFIYCKFKLFYVSSSWIQGLDFSKLARHFSIRCLISNVLASNDNDNNILRVQYYKLSAKFIGCVLEHKTKFRNNK